MDANLWQYIISLWRQATFIMTWQTHRRIFREIKTTEGLSVSTVGVCKAMECLPSQIGHLNILMTQFTRQKWRDIIDWPMTALDDSGMWLLNLVELLAIWECWKVAIILWFPNCLNDITYSSRIHVWDNEVIYSGVM